MIKSKDIALSTSQDQALKVDRFSKGRIMTNREARRIITDAIWRKYDLKDHAEIDEALIMVLSTCVQFQNAELKEELVNGDKVYIVPSTLPNTSKQLRALIEMFGLWECVNELSISSDELLNIKEGLVTSTENVNKISCMYGKHFWNED